MSFDVVVVGAGPAGAMAALRAAQLGAKTALVARGAFGGMAANDGPVPVRTLAHAARLVRDAQALGRYGIAGVDPALDYPRLLARVREVVDEVRSHSALRPQLDALGVTLLEHMGTTRFVDPHTLVTAQGPELRADRIVLCTGGASRRLPVPGFQLTATHSDAWALTSVPPSMLVVGGGATGVQVASVFSAFGTHVTLFEAGPRILKTEDEEVSRAVADAFRAEGIDVREEFGRIDRFERSPDGVRMFIARDSAIEHADAALAVMAVGWTADTAALHLAASGVAIDPRGFVRVDERQQTSVPHIFAAGDVTGGAMLVPQALHAGFVAGANACGAGITHAQIVDPSGSFTDPEYARVGLTEAAARAAHDVIVASVPFEHATRPIIDGRTYGFCKVIVERGSGRIVGCHVVGERAVDIVQVAALAMAAEMRVDALARIPLAFPTYAGVLGRAAAVASHRLGAADAGRLEMGASGAVVRAW